MATLYYEKDMKVKKVKTFRSGNSFEKYLRGIFKANTDKLIFRDDRCGSLRILNPDETWTGYYLTGLKMR